MASIRHDDKTRQVLSANESEGVSLLSQSSAKPMAYATFPRLRSPVMISRACLIKSPVTYFPALYHVVARRRLRFSALVTGFVFSIYRKPLNAS